MHYKNMDCNLNKIRYFFLILGSFILLCCSSGCALLNPSKYDEWRDEEMKREIKDVRQVIGQTN